MRYKMVYNRYHLAHLCQCDSHQKVYTNDEIVSEHPKTIDEHSKALMLLNNQMPCWVYSLKNFFPDYS